VELKKQNFEIYRNISELADVTLVANRHGKLFLPLFLPYAIILSLWQAHRYDAILLGDGVLAIVAWVLRLVHPWPLVFCILHGLDLTYSVSFYQCCWVRRFMPAVDVLLPVSRRTAIEVSNRGLRADRCHIIPNGVNPDECSEDYNHKRLDHLLGSQVGNRHIILTVGRLIERKGVLWFVENVLPELDQDIIYVVAGDGPMRKRIEKSIVQRGLDSRVFLLGQVDDCDLHMLYAAAEIYVQPNIPIEGDMEGFGLVVLEAGASGLPVIASRLEGLADAISEGDNGQLLTPGRADEYVAQIHALVHDEETRHAKGQRAMAYVRQHFQWKSIACRYVETFGIYLDNVFVEMQM